MQRTSVLAHTSPALKTGTVKASIRISRIRMVDTAIDFTPEARAVGPTTDAARILQRQAAHIFQPHNKRGIVYDGIHHFTKLRFDTRNGF